MININIYGLRVIRYSYGIQDIGYGLCMGSMQYIYRLWGGAFKLVLVGRCRSSAIGRVPVVVG